MLTFGVVKRGDLGRRGGGKADFGQSIFGHRVLPVNFGQSIFGQHLRCVVSGLANLGQSIFGQSIFVQTKFVLCCVVLCCVIVGFGPSGSPLRRTPLRRTPQRRTTQNFAFFFFSSPATSFFLSSLLLGSSRGILLVLKAGALKCSRLEERNKGGLPGFHTTAREPKRGHLSPSLQKHNQNSTIRHPERQKRAKMGAGEGKKSAKF